eukprot:13494054-Heterocapsa_arctica.AAC.1
MRQKERYSRKAVYEKKDDYEELYEQFGDEDKKEDDFEKLYEQFGNEDIDDKDLKPKNKEGLEFEDLDTEDEEEKKKMEDQKLYESGNCPTKESQDNEDEDRKANFEALTKFMKEVQGAYYRK